MGWTYASHLSSMTWASANDVKSKKNDRKHHFFWGTPRAFLPNGVNSGSLWTVPLFFSLQVVIHKKFAMI
jgi:hypothetical protein